MATRKTGAAGGEAAEETRVRRAVVDGISVDVDERVLSDVRTLRLVARVEREDEGSAFAAIELFDLLLGDAADAVVGALSDEDGFCQVDAYSSFCAEVMRQVGAKN